jgi:hypothetical protein
MVSSAEARPARSARRVAVLAVLLLVTGVLAGCVGHGGSTDRRAPEAGSSVAPATAPLRVRAAVTRVAGRLHASARKRVAARARSLVTTYLHSAFLGAEGPPRGTGAFPGFTPAARTMAQRDREVLTGAAYAGADRVVPRSARVKVNVVAPGGRAVGATAWVRLALAVTSGGHARSVDVAGRLLLTPTAHGWRIFGYDLSQSGRRARSSR